MYKEKVSIIDSGCGSGKSSWAIKYMNKNKDKKFLYVTPYLKEVDRILDDCEGFVTPTGYHKGFDLEKLINKGLNIATTHKLLHLISTDTVTKIKNSGYELILDEIIDVISEEKLKKNDKTALLKLGILKEEEGILLFDKKSSNINKYDGSEWAYRNIVNGLKRNSVEITGNKILIFLFPIDIFQAFDKIFLLTYMFDGYPMSPYFKMNNIEYKKYSAYYNTEINEFDIKEFEDLNNINIKKLITVFDDEKINSIGDYKSSFTNYWFERKITEDEILRLRKNIMNVLRHKVKCTVKDVMWTCFKRDIRSILNIYTKETNFVSHNIRATNDYSKKKVVVYLVSRNYNPIQKRWFKSKGITVNEDMFALGEMIQFIFRSRIRNNEEIFLYVPSKRMRGLFNNWLNDKLPIIK